MKGSYKTDCYLWVSSEVCWADALLFMDSHGTEGIEATGALDAAGVLALALVTNLARLAVPIGGAGT